MRLPRSFAFMALMALCACDTTASLQNLQRVKPSGDAYHQELAKLYRAYAEKELKSYDWWSSKYFADKGLLAAYGKNVQPEDPRLWEIHPTYMDSLLDARKKLIEVMDAPIAKYNPDIVALAVASYDCWVEQQEEEWKQDRIETCRDTFFAAIDALAQPLSTGEEIVEPAPKKQAVESTSSLLFFPFDSSSLAEEGTAILKQLVAYILSAGAVDIVINGHADRAGSGGYNMTLSQQRAEYIREQLLAAGVPPERIRYFAYGESEPNIPTEDGVAEPANRRVEIFIE